MTKIEWHCSGCDEKDKRIKRLEEALTEIARFLEDAPIECGICCCGDDVDKHGIGDGHTPVDQAAYAAMQWSIKARACLEEKP